MKSAGGVLAPPVVLFLPGFRHIVVALHTPASHVLDVTWGNI